MRNNENQEGYPDEKHYPLEPQITIGGELVNLYVKIDDYQIDYDFLKRFCRICGISKLAINFDWESKSNYKFTITSLNERGVATGSATSVSEETTQISEKGYPEWYEDSIFPPYPSSFCSAEVTVNVNMKEIYYELDQDSNNPIKFIDILNQKLSEKLSYIASEILLGIKPEFYYSLISYTFGTIYTAAAIDLAQMYMHVGEDQSKLGYVLFCNVVFYILHLYVEYFDPIPPWSGLENPNDLSDKAVKPDFLFPLGPKISRYFRALYRLQLNNSVVSKKTNGLES